MSFEINETNKAAMGGTELMMDRLYKNLPADLLDKFQIIPSRSRDLDKDKIRIMYIHDLPGDNNEYGHLANGGWSKYHKLVFVSNWQMQKFIDMYDIPWSYCVVIENAIVPINWTFEDKKSDKIKFIFHPVPYKGLEILVPVFVELLKYHDNIELDVFSNFDLYGHPNRNKPYEGLINICKNTNGINYYGTVSNDEIREALKKANIFAYPNTFPETSSLALIEAMSAGLICVHPNYGALYETALKSTVMYPWNEDVNIHANVFFNIINGLIKDYDINDERFISKILTSKKLIDMHHNLGYRIEQWKEFLISVSNLPLKDPAGETLVIYI